MEDSRMSEEDRYKQMMALRAELAGGESDSSLGEAESPDTTGVPTSRGMNMQTPEAQTGNQGKLQSAGDMTMAAGATTMNPYVAAAGAVMKGAGMVDDAARKGEQSKIDAYNKKIMAQRSAIRNMFA